MRRSWRVCALALAVFPLGRAAAWSNARVEGVRANVEQLSRGDLLVALELDVQVRAGRLTRLEVAGLGEARVSDAKPAWIRSEDAAKRSPTARTYKNGALVVELPPKQGLPRGTHTIGVSYIQQSQGSHHQAMAWTMPAWPNAVVGPRIRLVAPTGASRAGGHGDEETHVAVERFGQHTVLVFERPYLPREVPWRVRALPVEGSSSPTSPPPAPSAMAEEAQDSATHLRGFAGLVFVMLVLLWQAVFRRRARKFGLRTRPWVPKIPAWLRVGLFLLSASAAWLAAERSPLAQVALLALACALIAHHSPRACRPSLGCWRPVTSSELRCARWWLAASGWFDPDSARGTLGLSVLALAGWFAWREFSGQVEVFAYGLWLIPVAAVASLLPTPQGARARAARMLAAAKRSSLFEPVAYSASFEKVQEARMRLRHNPIRFWVPRIDLVCVPTLLSRQPTMALLAVSAGVGDSVRKLRAVLSGLRAEEVHTENRTAFLVPVEDEKEAAAIVARLEDRLRAAPESTQPVTSGPPC